MTNRAFWIQLREYANRRVGEIGASWTCMGCQRRTYEMTSFRVEPVPPEQVVYDKPEQPPVDYWLWCGDCGARTGYNSSTSMTSLCVSENCAVIRGAPARSHLTDPKIPRPSLWQMIRGWYQ